MKLKEFVALMRKAKPRQRIVYHTGNLVEDRATNRDLDDIAKFVKALYELDLARIWHQGDDYYVSLLRRLKIRRDEQGSLQEALRLMKVIE